MRKGMLAGCCIEAHKHKPEGLRLLAGLLFAWTRTCDYGEWWIGRFVLCVNSSFSKEHPVTQDASTGPFRSAIV
jgi:hypothetical protein